MKCIFAVVAILLLSGCVTHTYQTFQTAALQPMGTSPWSEKDHNSRLSEQPKDIQALISRGIVEVGMTKEQVALSWGIPTHIIYKFKHTGSISTVTESETWRYTMFRFVILEKDVVVEVIED